MTSHHRFRSNKTSSIVTTLLLRKNRLCPSTWSISTKARLHFLHLLLQRNLFVSCRNSSITGKCFQDFLKNSFFLLLLLFPHLLSDLDKDKIRFFCLRLPAVRLYKFLNNWLPFFLLYYNIFFTITLSYAILQVIVTSVTHTGWECIHVFWCLVIYAIWSTNECLEYKTGYWIAHTILYACLLVLYLLIVCSAG